jgi:hypothetical protein
MSSGSPPRRSTYQPLGHADRAERAYLRASTFVVVLFTCLVFAFMTWLPRTISDAHARHTEGVLTSCASIPCLDDKQVCIDLVLNTSLGCAEALRNRTLACEPEARVLIDQCQSADAALYFDPGFVAYLAVLGCVNVVCIWAIIALVDLARENRRALASLRPVLISSEATESAESADSADPADDDRVPTLELDLEHVLDDTHPDTESAEPDATVGR